MTAEVTGPQRLSRLENGLVVSGKFTAFTKSTAIRQKLKEKIMHIKELYKHMEMKTTICSPTCIVMSVQLELKRLEIPVK